MPKQGQVRHGRRKQLTTQAQPLAVRPDNWARWGSWHENTTDYDATLHNTRTDPTLSFRNQPELDYPARLDYRRTPEGGAGRQESEIYERLFSCAVEFCDARIGALLAASRYRGLVWDRTVAHWTTLTTIQQVATLRQRILRAYACLLDPALGTPTWQGNKCNQSERCQCALCGGGGTFAPRAHYRYCFDRRAEWESIRANPGVWHDLNPGDDPDADTRLLRCDRTQQRGQAWSPARQHQQPSHARAAAPTSDPAPEPAPGHRDTDFDAPVHWDIAAGIASGEIDLTPWHISGSWCIVQPAHYWPTNWQREYWSHTSWHRVYSITYRQAECRNLILDEDALLRATTLSLHRLLEPTPEADADAALWAWHGWSDTIALAWAEAGARRTVGGAQIRDTDYTDADDLDYDSDDLDF